MFSLLPHRDCTWSGREEAYIKRWKMCPPADVGQVGQVWLQQMHILAVVENQLNI